MGLAAAGAAAASPAKPNRRGWTFTKTRGRGRRSRRAMSSDPTPVAASESSSSADRDVPWVRTRRFFTEAFGTFLLVIVDAGGAVIAQLSGGEVTPEARSLATGLLIMAMIYAMGGTSGAHFNPAVTFAFAVRR